MSIVKNNNQISEKKSKYYLYYLKNQEEVL